MLQGDRRCSRPTTSLHLGGEVWPEMPVVASPVCADRGPVHGLATRAIFEGWAAIFGVHERCVICSANSDLRPQKRMHCSDFTIAAVPSWHRPAFARQMRRQIFFGAPGATSRFSNRTCDGDLTRAQFFKEISSAPFFWHLFFAALAQYNSDSHRKYGAPGHRRRHHPQTETRCR